MSAETWVREARLRAAKRAAARSGPSIDDQFRRYETHGRVFEQVAGFFGSSATIVQLYATLTGGFWVAAGSDSLKLHLTFRIAALVFHMILSVLVLFALAALANTILQRFLLLRQLERRYWPALGGGIAVRAIRIARGKLPKWLRYFGLPAYANFWMIVPLIGLLGSMALGIMLLWQDAAKDIPTHQCRAAAEKLWLARDRESAEGGKFIFETLHCTGDTFLAAAPKAEPHTR